MKELSRPEGLAEARHGSIRALALLFYMSFESASFVSWLPSQAGSRLVIAILALVPRSTQQTLASVGSHVNS